MWPDRVSNQGPQALDSDKLPTATRDPAVYLENYKLDYVHSVTIIKGHFYDVILRQQGQILLIDYFNLVNTRIGV